MENINFGQPPFKQGYEYSGYIYDKDGHFCFQIDLGLDDMEDNKKLYKIIVDILNEKSTLRFKGRLSIIDGYKIIITETKQSFITIRGWGYLTGCGGGLCLDHEKAKQIQDNLALFIYNKLLGII